jgi:ferritin
MISKKINKALNKQLNREYHSAYIYLGLSTYAASEGYNGFASWFMIQSKEEMAHGMKLYKYLEDQGAKIKLKDIQAYNFSGKDIKEAFKAALEHEQKMTKWLNELSGLAMEQKDHATYNMLQWYVTEQVEEEASFNEILDKIEIVGTNGNGMYNLDKELGSRTFVDPTQE